MNNTEALIEMRKSTSVQDWNRRREKVLNKISLTQWEDSLHYEIDGKGLIVEVLGVDEKRTRQPQQQ